jgi:hypothetical protein
VSELGRGEEMDPAETIRENGVMAPLSSHEKGAFQ